jgi:hypothetical protein
MTIPVPDDLPFLPDCCSIRCCSLGCCRAVALKVTNLQKPEGIHLGTAGSYQDPAAEVVAATAYLGKEVAQAKNHMPVVLGQYKVRWEVVEVVERQD